MSKTLVSIMAGLGGMFGWGISDFFANISSEKIGHMKTFLWTQLVGLIIISIATIVVSPPFDITPNLIPFLGLSVLGYVVGLLYYYKSFEIGNLSVVAVVINLNAVFTMLVAYFFFGQRLTGNQLPAVALIIVGVMLVSVNFREIIKNRKISVLSGVKEAIIASVGFGVIHWPITEFIVERASWIWNTLIIRILAITFVVLLSVINKQKFSLPKNKAGLVAPLLISGVLESIAILSVNYGFTVGDSILISPIANSVAVVTVTMAVVFLKEKLTNIQTLGIAMTVLGIILTAF